MKILLIGNYAPDRQESMQRFAQVLELELQTRGVTVEVIRPAVRYGGFADPHRGWSKWCGYLDKFVLFPRQLRRLARQWAASPGQMMVHICDQANAPYVHHLGTVPHLVTCCDLLAIRCAAGEFAGPSTRWSGRQLQRLILRGLIRAQRLTCISEATRRDLLRFTNRPAQTVDVTPMGLNYPYRPMAAPEARAMVQSLLQSSPSPAPGLESHSYLLHVGGNQWYKNRLGVLRIYQQLKLQCPTAPLLVMAGKEFTEEMRRFVVETGLQSSVVSLSGCDSEQLRALYSLAELLLFPSLEEGFGWPIIEGHACGCRVVTTERAPMTEVGGDAAMYVNPADPASAASKVTEALRVTPHQRQEQVKLGLRNATRFSTAGMIERYLEIYAQQIRGYPGTHAVEPHPSVGRELAA